MGQGNYLCDLPLPHKNCMHVYINARHCDYGDRPGCAPFDGDANSAYQHGIWDDQHGECPWMVAMATGPT